MISAKEIQFLPVRCENIVRGCDWEGNVETLEDHMTTCPFTLVPSKEDISCPNQGCLTKMKCEEINAHVQTACDYTIVDCPYKNIGCKVKKVRKEIQKHTEDYSFHVHMVLSTVSDLKRSSSLQQKTIQELQTTVMELELAYREQKNTLKDGQSMLIKMTGFKSKKERNEEFLSESFMTNLCGCKIRMIVYANGDDIGKGSYLSIYTYLLEGPQNMKQHWSFLGNMKIELLNQLVDDHHYTKKIIHNVVNDKKVGESWGYVKFIPHSKLSFQLASNTQYLMNDTLYIRVTVTVDDHKKLLICTKNGTTKCTPLISSLIRDSQTHRGTSITFRLSNYSTLKVEDDQFDSEEFYTGPHGYKICISVDANGDGEASGSHVSIFTKISQGPYDSELHWPFTGTVKYELLNQLADSNHHIKISTFTSAHNMLVFSSKGLRKFISHCDLFHDPDTITQYLMDDTLYFRVTVTVDGHKPWLACTHHTM